MSTVLGVPSRVGEVEEGAGIVQVVRALDQPRPKYTDIEVKVRQCVIRDGGDTVET